MKTTLALLIGALFCASAEAQNLRQKKTLLTDGFETPGFGEIGVISHKIQGVSRTETPVRFAWQLVRIGQQSLNLGAELTGMLSKPLGAGPFELLEQKSYGPTMEYVAFPGSRIHGGAFISYLKTSLRRQHEGDDFSKQASGNTVNYGVSVGVQVTTYADLVLSTVTERTKLRNGDREGITTEGEQRYLRLALRGTLLD